MAPVVPTLISTFLSAVPLAAAVEGIIPGILKPHPKCQDMAQYQAPYVNGTYDRSRHMGHYYELAFRDLYPRAPLCDCMHTYKVADADRSYHESFEFYCNFPTGADGRLATLLLMNSTAESETISRQSFAWANVLPPIPGIQRIGYHTGVVAFKEVPGQHQYEWVLEFTCDPTDPIPLRLLFGGHTFVGINLYSRSGPTNQTNLDEMIAAVKDLGLEWTLDNTWGWGFHEVPHKGVGGRGCACNPPDVTEYTCESDACVPTRWGAGTILSACKSSCGRNAVSV